ncbi:hypothetical protein L7F22_068098 [Adiantum nelumboides]|nr:hypothetical protein [Adiantum nelumboides]
MAESLKGSVDDVAAPSVTAKTELKKDDVEDSASVGSARGSSDPNTIPPSIIDMEIFGQLLEMDDEEDREFSKEIVWNYFDQAETTFQKMDDALEKKDLPELSTLGHFLKGSSAAVGVIKVRDSCEYMQHYGKKADKDGITELSEEESLDKIRTTLRDVKVEYKEAEKALRQIYSDASD